MSTQKDLISDPSKARRSKASVLAEAVICKAFGWPIEFLSGGYDSFSTDELVDISRLIFQITGEKLWLNIGVLSEEELARFVPYARGFCGAMEVIDETLHDEMCPSKPVSEILDSFRACDSLGLEKAMTMIVGLGEKREHFSKLKEFITKYGIDRITFYRLKPQKGTPFTQGPESEDYVWWVRETRKAFPDIDIVVGSWLTHLDEISSLLEAGADSITKFPSIKLFGSVHAFEIEKQAKKAGRVFEGTLTEFQDFDWPSLLEGVDMDSDFKEQVLFKLDRYLSRMKKNIYTPSS